MLCSLFYSYLKTISAGLKALQFNCNLDSEH